MAYIARNRLALVHCDCQLSERASRKQRRSRRSSKPMMAPQWYRYALFISGFCMVMAISFFYTFRVLSADRVAPVCHIKFLGEGDLS